MPSSTSSSERAGRAADAVDDLLHPPAGLRWGRLLGGALALALATTGALELGLRLRGYGPTIEDTAVLWRSVRAEASAAGGRALPVIGASRIQLGLDPALLAASMGDGSRPLQLAIDGSSWRPVLRDLADDPTFRGRVVVDWYPHVIAADAPPHAWMGAHGRGFDWMAPGEALEQRLASPLRRHLALLADGGRPVDNVARRLFALAPVAQYLETRPDRSRAADYALVPMPAFAEARALRHLGLPDAAGDPRPAAERIAEAIARARPVAADAAVLAQWDAIARDIAAIRARGGDVVFVKMPTSGAVAAFDAARHPDATWWDGFLAHVGARGVHASREPTLAGFTCPDGSHLDRRDQAAFTAALAPLLREAFAAGPPAR